MEPFNIVGGTYYEWCEDPQWDELYGSGFRAAVALSAIVKKISFYTYADASTAEILQTLSSHLQIRTAVHDIPKSISFFYQHPLANPDFLPEPSAANTTPIKLAGVKRVLTYGMLEGNAIIEAEKVIYDPQRPSAPISFWSNGSKAEKLIMVLNYKEASIMAKSENIETIQNFLIQKERVSGAIVKHGADGAFVIEPGKPILQVPAFRTSRVWPIGSGDIFSAHLGFHLFEKQQTLCDAALQASLATASYVNSRLTTQPATIEADIFPAFIKTHNGKKKLYLAGPFFTMAERWLISQARVAFLKAGFEVFSPLHDVGIGEHHEVVDQDIEAIRSCDVLAAVCDGLDAGTLFEIGYARAMGKIVTVFLQNEKDTSLTMLQGTTCLIEEDFSTWVYKTVWQTYQ